MKGKHKSTTCIGASPRTTGKRKRSTTYIYIYIYIYIYYSNKKQFNKQGMTMSMTRTDAIVVLNTLTSPSFGP